MGGGGRVLYEGAAREELPKDTSATRGHESECISLLHNADVSDLVGLGSQFEEITGAMSGRHLLIRYPNSKSFRVENRSVSGGS